MRQAGASLLETVAALAVGSVIASVAARQAAATAATIGEISARSRALTAARNTLEAEIGLPCGGRARAGRACPLDLRCTVSRETAAVSPRSILVAVEVRSLRERRAAMVPMRLATVVRANAHCE